MSHFARHHRCEVESLCMTCTATTPLEPVGLPPKTKQACNGSQLLLWFRASQVTKKMKRYQAQFPLLSHHVCALVHCTRNIRIRPGVTCQLSRSHQLNTCNMTTMRTKIFSGLGCVMQTTNPKCMQGGNPCRNDAMVAPCFSLAKCMMREWSNVTMQGQKHVRTITLASATV